MGIGFLPQQAQSVCAEITLQQKDETMTRLAPADHDLEDRRRPQVRRRAISLIF
jgi:hypothetical protein